MALSDPGPWLHPAEVMNRFARLDRSLADKLNVLSELQARDNKLAEALESGRIYGLRQQKFDMMLKKQLNRQWRKAPTEAPW